MGQPLSDEEQLRSCISMSKFLDSGSYSFSVVGFVYALCDLAVV